MDTQKKLKQSTGKFSNFSISRVKYKLTSVLLPKKKTRKALTPYQNKPEVKRVDFDAKMKRTVLSCSLPLYAIVFSFVLVAVFQGSYAFQLDGSANSFAQFRKWYTSLNGSLELDFKTEQPNGLVLYTDDGGTYDFFELKLVEGALRLRYNLGGGAQIITVGRDLHDGHWHKVQVGFLYTLYIFFFRYSK